MRNIEYSIAEIKLLCEEYKNAACAGKDGKLGALKEEIQALVDEIEKEAPRVNNDSAFFAGELNAKLGEKEVEHPEHVKAYRERRDRRMTHRRIDAEEEERKGGHGNTHIPFGLCQREGIAVQPGWTPRDAWSALASKGYDIGSVYRELRETGKVAPRGAASSQYKRPAAQEKALGRIAEKTAGLKREQYRIVDQDGNVVLENRGDRHSVPSTVGEKREHLPGNASIHNHPDGGTFSPDDLRDFGYGAREMVVAGPDGAYSLVNAKYGTKEQAKGWYDMQQALIKACPETSTLKLLQQARKNLESCEERKRMSAISEEFVRRKDAGESTDELREWINGTGYDELEARYKEKLGAEQRRLEVEPFHRFYQENAEKYGFLYRFTPKGRDLFERAAERAKGAVERMHSEPDAPTMEKDMEAQGYTKNAEGHWVKRSDAADRERMDAIERYRLRREKRLSRLDEEGRWVTTENDHKVHINEEGVPDKGNPHVLATMRGEGKNPKTAEEVVRARVQRKHKAIHESAKRCDELSEAHDKAVDEKSKADRELTKVRRGLRRAESGKEFISKLGYGEGDKAKMEREAEKLQLQIDKLKNNRPITALSEEEKAKLDELQAQKNKMEFGAEIYDDCYGPNAFTQEKLDAATRKADEADRAMRKAEQAYLTKKKALRKLASSGDIDMAKLYSPDQRRAVEQEVLTATGWGDMSEEQKKEAMKSLQNASDAEISLLRKTFGGVRITDGRGAVFSSGADSWYTPGTGAITLSTEDLSKPRILWHEFGHYLDDPEKSGCSSGNTRILGSVYRDSLSHAVMNDETLHGKAAAADMQRLVDSKFPGRFRIESDGGNMLRVWDMERGEYVDGSTDMSISYCLDKAVNNRFLTFTYSDKRYEDFMRSINCPREEERPKWEDYFECYTTPKRKLERTREKHKGGGDEYHKKIREYYDKREKAISEHREDYERETESYYARCKQREAEIGPVSDILCGMMRGHGAWIYGSHPETYYSRMDSPAKEAVAHFHQMRVMRSSYGLELLKSMVPSVYDGLEQAYNEWLWRNVEL